jgi:hypothetical protein
MRSDIRPQAIMKIINLFSNLDILESLFKTESQRHKIKALALLRFVDLLCKAFSPSESVSKYLLASLC